MPYHKSGNQPQNYSHQAPKRFPVFPLIPQIMRN
jgi:hypothetical protein